MKWLAYIFSFYLLAITCLPCADNDCKEATVSLTATAHQDEHHQGDEEKSCSPFCYCSCCQTVCTTKYSPIVMLVPFQEKEEKQSTINSTLQDNFSAIWQPPKIG